MRARASFNPVSALKTAGIKIKLQLAFGAVALMTVMASGVALYSFGAAEQGGGDPSAWRKPSTHQRAPISSKRWSSPRSDALKACRTCRSRSRR